MKKIALIKSNILASLVFLLTALNTEAKDLGRQGAVFEIREEGFIAMIQRRLAGVDIDEHNKKIVEVAKERAVNPVPVFGISKAEEDREFYYDPTFLVKEDIKLTNGKVLYKTGVAVNPLSHMDFDRRLIFIDGRDAEQVKWLNEQQPDSRYVDRIILIAGRIFDLQESLGKQLYFDQAGEITSKFGIKHVPAIVVAAGDKLKINEIKI